MPASCVPDVTIGPGIGAVGRRRVGNTWYPAWFTAFDGRLLSRLRAGFPLATAEWVGVSAEFLPIASRVQAAPLEDREAIVAEWLAGFEPAEAEGIKQAVLDAARLPSPEGEAEATDRARPLAEVRVILASEMHSQPVEWLWPDRIPLGMLTMLSGDPKLGKSLVTLAMAAAVSRGVPLPGGDAAPGSGPGRVWLLSAEDDPGRTIVPRLRAAGADLRRIHLVTSILVPGVPAEPGNPGSAVPPYERLPTLLEHDLAVLEDRVKRSGDGRLIVVDPVSAYLGGTDDHRNADLRGLLAPLKAMAERLGVAVVLVSHLSKGGGTNGKYRVMGSIAYVGTCRANFLFVRDRTDPTGRRVLFCDNGGNLAPPAPTLAYTIEENEHGPYVGFVSEPVAVTAEQALVDEVEAGHDRRQAAERGEAEQWLREMLAGGPVAAKEILSAARECGLSKTTLKRAKASLGVISIREGFVKDARFTWKLPNASNSWPAPP